MKDVEYVQKVLATDYQTEYRDEIPYPELSTLIEQTEFDYASGKVVGEESFGNKNRDGLRYLRIKHNDKSIYCHRFIVALTLGKWPPRDLVIDHINHNITDNRPENLRLVTTGDNSRNRRKATLPELADIGKIAEELAIAKLERLEARKTLEETQKSSQTAPLDPVSNVNKSSDAEFYSQNWNSTPKLQELHYSEVATLKSEKVEDNAREKTSSEPSMSHFYSIPRGHPVFTGETKPAIPSGVWHKTTIGSWWWRKD